MAIHSRFNDLVYTTKQDAKQFDLTNIKESTGLVLATADNLQKRAVTNKNAANELAIKLSELNAAPGEDQLALEGKVNDTMKYIEDKVDEEGHWAFADTVVTDASKQFLTDGDVKHILSQKVSFDKLNELNSKSDASEEYKAANMAMILEAYNAAGGALGGDGRQTISSFGTALGKGHDRSIYQKEFTEMMKAWKADSNYLYTPQVINDITELMKLPGTPQEAKAAAQKIIAMRGGNLSGFLNSERTIESISDEEVKLVFRAILNNRPEFKSALQHEAKLNRWMANKQGISNSYLAQSMISSYINTSTNIQNRLLQSSDFSSLSKVEQQKALKNPDLINRYIKQGLNNTFGVLNMSDNETIEDYEDRMAYMYDSMYFEQNVESLLNMSNIVSYTSVKGKTTPTFFDNLLLDQLKAGREVLKQIKGEQTGRLAYSRANLPYGTMSDNIQEDKNNVLATMKKAEATMNLYAGGDDDVSKTMHDKAQAEYQKALNEYNMLTQYENSAFKEAADKIAQNPKAFQELKGKLIEDAIFSGENGKGFADKIKGAENLKDLMNIVNEFEDKGFIDNRPWYNRWFGGGEYDKLNSKNISSRIIDIADDYDLIEKEQTRPITIFTPISKNKNEYNNRLQEVIDLFATNPGRWNYASVSRIKKAGGNPVYDKDFTGVPVVPSEDVVGLFSKHKSGDSTPFFDPSDKMISLAADENGKLLLHITVNPQGTNSLPETYILETTDDGLNKQLKDCLYAGLQCTYNQSLTDNTDTYQLDVFKELSNIAGDLEQLNGSLKEETNPQLRSLNNYNTINGTRVYTPSAFANEVIKDLNVSVGGTTHNMYSGNYKYEVTKYRGDVYNLKIYEFNEEIKDYVPVSLNDKPLEFKFEDDRSFKNSLGSIVCRLNQGNSLLKNFFPTTDQNTLQQDMYRASVINMNMPDVFHFNK